jgi:hypothetical protein
MAAPASEPTGPESLLRQPPVEGAPNMSNTQSDRSRVAASDPSEVRYFGKKHGLTDDQVLDLIKQHGNNRETLEAAVARQKGPARA